MPQTWEITVQYVVVFIACFVVMKLVNFASSARPARNRLNYLLLSPFLSIRAWERRCTVERPALLNLLFKAGIILPLLVAVYSLFPPFLAVHSFPAWTRGYLAVVPFLVFAEGIGVFVQLVLLPIFGMLPPFLDRPHLSRNLSEFWGRRWNPWHGGWFWEVVFRSCPRRPLIGAYLAFLASGLWHEVLVSVPLWFVFRESVFGQMTVYFAIQASGLVFGHRCLRNHNFVRRVWTWAIVILPAPLALNQGTLLIFHLSPP